MNSYTKEQVKALVNCANYFEGTPFESYLMGFVYPELIEEEDAIPKELMTNRLIRFRDALIGNELKIDSFLKEVNKNKIHKKELLPYAKIASDSLIELSIDQLEAIIECSNQLENTPFECFVMKTVYPEIINMYCEIPQNLVSNRLKKFKEDLISNDINALQLFIELRNNPLSPAHLPYYYMIKESYEKLNPCIQEEAKVLLNIKNEQVNKRLSELEKELNTATSLAKSLSMIINTCQIKDQPLIRSNKLNQKELVYLIHDLATNSTFKTLMTQPI